MKNPTVLPAAAAGITLAITLAILPQQVGAQNRVVAEVPIRVDRGRTLVPVTIGSSGPFELILDSGMAYDGIVMFDTAGVDLRALGRLGQVRVPGAGDGEPSRGLSTASGAFAVGDIAFEGQRVTMLTESGWSGNASRGVIGYSLLGHYAVELDYDRARMIVYEADAFVPGEGWTPLDVTFRGNRIPWIPIAVATADEPPVQLDAYIDFASREAVELLERDTNAFAMPVLTGDSTYGRGLSGDVRGRRGRVGLVKVGSFELRDVSVNLVPARVRSRQPDADAIVGNDLLRRFNVIFDLTRDRLYLRPNRVFDEPFR